MKKAFILFLVLTGISSCIYYGFTRSDSLPYLPVVEDGFILSFLANGDNIIFVKNTESLVKDYQPLAENTADSIISNSWKLLLVNRDSPLTSSEEPERLVSVTGTNFKVDSRILPSLEQMISDALKEGVDLLVISAYRSVDTQQNIYDNVLNSYLALGNSYDEAIAETENYVALPYCSEHHTGLAVDIVTPSYTRLDEGFANTTAATWMALNCSDYGFIIRYPKGKEAITKISYEPWHLRYVGIDVADEIMSKGITLEEYLN